MRAHSRLCICKHLQTAVGITLRVAGQQLDFYCNIKNYLEDIAMHTFHLVF